MLFGFAFVVALVAYLRRRLPAQVGEAGAESAGRDPRAEELRRKLAEARDAPNGDGDLAGAEPGSESGADAGSDVDEHRRRVREQARGVLEEMRRSEEE